MKKLIIILFLPLFISCDFSLEEAIEPDDTFVIKEGQHTSTFAFKSTQSKTVTFDAKFHTCAQYKCLDPVNQEDLNKLMGFSSCGTHHHENSARIGWRWFNDQLEIWGYIYDGGNRRYEYITSVPLNEFVQYEITKNSEGYLFKVNGAELQMITEYKCDEGTNYMLYPYFGGDETAPQDITIVTKNLTEE